MFNEEISNILWIVITIAIATFILSLDYESMITNQGLNQYTTEKSIAKIVSEPLGWYLLAGSSIVVIFYDSNSIWNIFVEVLAWITTQNFIQISQRIFMLYLLTSNRWSVLLYYFCVFIWLRFATGILAIHLDIYLNFWNFWKRGNWN